MIALAGYDKSENCIRTSNGASILVCSKRISATVHQPVSCPWGQCCSVAPMGCFPNHIFSLQSEDQVLCFHGGDSSSGVIKTETLSLPPWSLLTMKDS
jgi:hypothetical protein